MRRWRRNSPSRAAPVLDPIAALARAAGREIHAIWKAGFAVDTKGDGSPVTVADRRAEAIILSGLAEIAPAIPVVAEEEVADGRCPDPGARFFLVDPLDGTRGFAEGGPASFTVNIGLVSDGRPVLGAVYAPATGELWAGAGDTAFGCRCDPATALEIAPRKPLRVAARTGAWRLVGSRSFGGPKFKAFAKAVGAASTAEESSSIKFCRIASGDADIYPRFGPMKEWDVAAGHAVLAAAGGGVMGLDAAAIRYGRATEHFDLDGLVAFGGAHAEAAARRALATL